MSNLAITPATLKRGLALQKVITTTNNSSAANLPQIEDNPSDEDKSMHVRVNTKEQPPAQKLQSALKSKPKIVKVDDQPATAYSDASLAVSKGALESKREALKMKEKFSTILNSQQLVDEEAVNDLQTIGLTQGMSQRPLVFSKESARNVIARLNLASQGDLFQRPYTSATGSNVSDRMKTLPDTAEDRQLTSSEIPRTISRSMKRGGSLSISSKKLREINLNTNSGASTTKQSQTSSAQQNNQQRQDNQKSSPQMFLSSRLLFKQTAGANNVNNNHYMLLNQYSGQRLHTASSKQSSITEMIPNLSKPGSKGKNPAQLIEPFSSMKNRVDGISNAVTPRRQVYSSGSVGTLSSTGSRELKFRKLLNNEEQQNPLHTGQSAFSSRQSMREHHRVTKPSTPAAVGLTMPEQRETPLLSQGESATNWKVKHSQSLNNVYLKMLDEFQIPYEQDFDKIRKKISEMQLMQETSVQPSGGVSASTASIDKKFVMNLLQSQLELKKTESQKTRQLRVPTNRYDVEVLKHWLDFMVFKIYQEEADSGKDILDKIQSVLESCFQEILKQVSVDCQTRGDLLSKVWRNQNSLNMRQIEEEQKLRRETEQEGLDEISRIHRMYSTEVAKLLGQIQGLMEEKNTFQEKFSVMKTNLKYLKKNNHHMLKQTKALKYEIDFLQKKNSDLEYASQQLKKEYINLSNTHQSLSALKKEQHERRQSQNKHHHSTKSSKSITKLGSKQQPSKPITSMKLLQVPSSDQQSTQHVHLEVVRNSTDTLAVHNEHGSDSDNNRSANESYFEQNPVTAVEIITDRNLRSFQIIPESTDRINVQQQMVNRGSISRREKGSDESDSDDDGLYSLIIVEKGVDTQDWNELYATEFGVQTEVEYQGDKVRDKHIQVDFKTEFGSYLLQDKEVQTTELDPEYLERMKGMDVRKLEKNMDHLNQIEHELEASIAKFQLPFDVKKPVYDFVKLVNKNADSMQNMLKEEIGLKEQYHKDIITQKLTSKELSLKLEEIVLKAEKLEESNRNLANDNEELQKEIAALQRRTKKLNTHLEKVSAAQTKVFAETSKLAENMQRSSFMMGLIGKAVNTDLNSSSDEIEEKKESNQTSQQLQQPATNNNPGTSISSFPELTLEGTERKSLAKIGQIASPPQIQKQAQPQTKQALLKIQNAVRQLIKLDMEKHNQNDLSSSSDSDNEGPYANKPGSAAPSNIPALQQHRSSTVIKKNSKQSEQNNSFQSQAVMSSSKQSIVLDKQSKAVAQPYKFLEPKFERKRVMKIASQHIGPSMNLFNKIQRKMQKSGQAKMTMTRKNLCKYISLIYNERLKNEAGRNDPFHVCCYDFFMSHFGLKRVAESKIMQLYESIFFFKSKSPRVKLFGRFLNLFDDFTVDELDYYLTNLQKLDEESPPFVQALTCTAEVVQGSFDKILAFLRRTDDGTGSMEKQIAMAQKYKVQHQRDQSYQVLDVDLIFEGVLESYQKIKLSNKGLETLFNAGDLDKDNMIGFYEFMCLCKYIEQMSDGSEKLIASERLFFMKCDLIHSDTGEKALSIEQFFSLATQTGLFSSEKIDAFVKEQTAQSDCLTFDNLKKKQADVLQQMKMRFYKAGLFNPFLSTSIRKLSEAISLANPSDQLRERAIWLSYRILELESKHVLLLSEIQDCMPQQFIDILISQKEQTEEPEEEFCGINFTSNQFSWA